MQQQQNLKTVINLCAEFPGYRGLYGELDIHQLRLGTTDYTVPTLDKIEAGVLAIMEIAEHGDGSVYIHCKGDVYLFLFYVLALRSVTNTFWYEQCSWKRSECCACSVLFDTEIPTEPTASTKCVNKSTGADRQRALPRRADTHVLQKHYDGS
jgi:hypothetical protein